MAFTLKSPAFGHGRPIPAKYTADGDNISPPLEWSGAPRGAKSFILIVEDPDAPAGTFRHWGIYNLKGDRLSEGAAAKSAAANDFGMPRYRGPAPPKGHGTHHYHFKLAALDVDMLKVPASAEVADLWPAAKGHIIGETELIGTYSR
jgi:Raf kinase inhibitor-like YbhB/YbcL family protein